MTLKLPDPANTRTPFAQSIARAEQAKNIFSLNNALVNIRLTAEEERALLLLSKLDCDVVDIIIQTFNKAHLLSSKDCDRESERVNLNKGE